jgi:hypothetical protein
LRAHRLFVQDDVILLRSASSQLKDLGFDDRFFVEAEALSRKVDAMLTAERRDGKSDGMPRFTWDDVTLLERLATRLTESDRIAAARHWRSLLANVREELKAAGN